MVEVASTGRSGLLSALNKAFATVIADPMLPDPGQHAAPAVGGPGLDPPPTVCRLSRRHIGLSRIGPKLTPPALGYESVELRLVAGLPQLIHEGTELPLLIVQFAQRIVTMIVEAVIAARPSGSEPQSPSPIKHRTEL